MRSRCAIATTSRTTSPTRSPTSRRTTSSGYIEAVESVVGSFETREDYLEDVAVADTALVLQELAQRRGLEQHAARVARSSLVRLALRDQRVERDRDRLQRLRLVLELVQLVDELVQERAHRLDVELRVHLGAAELALGGEEVEAALQLAQLRPLQLAREPGRADLRRRP